MKIRYINSKNVTKNTIFILTVPHIIKYRFMFPVLQPPFYCAHPPLAG